MHLRMFTHFFILPHFPSPSPFLLLSLPAAACGRSTAVLRLAGSGCCHEQLVWEGKVSGCCNRPCYTYVVHAVALLVHTYIRTYVLVCAELCFTCWTYTENATCITGMNLGDIIVRFHRIINIIALINKWLLTVHTVHSVCILWKRKGRPVQCSSFNLGHKLFTYVCSISTM